MNEANDINLSTLEADAPSECTMKKIKMSEILKLSGYTLFIKQNRKGDTSFE